MKNMLEKVVGEIYDELLARDPGYCRCEQCRTDVLSKALNQARPKYSGGGPKGEAIAGFELQQDATRAALAVVLLDAMRRVAGSPRHAPSKEEKSQ
ncbi:MAG: late competence development ComFB family protein [Anaerolineae bacterium]|nr:late competence development ComFB family protein [Gemmatimonadaceae bacterium]